MSQDRVLFPRVTIVINRCEKQQQPWRLHGSIQEVNTKASNMRVSAYDTNSATVNPGAWIYI